MNDVFLSLKGIYKSFGGVNALNGVDLTIRRGEIHCLAGENGSGKSTLIKVISGVHPASAGEMTIEGRRVTGLTPIEAIQYGIQVIYQDFAVFSNLTVAENIAMNHALMTGAKRMKWREARRLALDAMEQIGAKMDPDALVEQLSVANKQMVAICRAIINDAKLLILDEPTTALTSNEIHKLYAIMRRLKERGIAVVMVNHKLDEIYDIADRLTILRNGENISTGLIGEYDRKRFVRDLTGRELADCYYQPVCCDEEIFRAEDIRCTGAFEGVSFTLRKGDVLGITGLLGSGCGQIGDALFGVTPVTGGRLSLHGKPIRIRSIQDAMRYRIGYVPEDRLTQGLFLDRSILDNTVAASLARYFNGMRLNTEQMAQDTRDWIHRIGCNAPGPEPSIRTLSGGNAQKMVIAKWLNTDPALLVLNGPTVGVDVGSKADIHAILHSLSEKGVGVIVISDDLPELLHNCNHILVMRDGRPAATVRATDVDATTLAHMLSDKDAVTA